MPEPTSDGVPATLAGSCVVEDWVSPEEDPPRYWSAGTSSLGPVQDRMSYAQIVARHRLRDARKAWAAANGVSRDEAGELFGSIGRPVFRDGAVFRDAVVRRVVGRD